MDAASLAAVDVLSYCCGFFFEYAKRIMSNSIYYGHRMKHFMLRSDLKSKILFLKFVQS